VHAQRGARSGRALRHQLERHPHDRGRARGIRAREPGLGAAAIALAAGRGAPLPRRERAVEALHLQVVVELRRRELDRQEVRFERGHRATAVGGIEPRPRHLAGRRAAREVDGLRGTKREAHRVIG